jgi:uncharacterized integral membrane protein (TIGR00698 family)
MQRHLPGILLSVGLAALGYLLASWVPGFNAVLWALLLGVLVGNLSSLAPAFQTGVGFGGKQVLNWAIIFLGFDVSARQITSLGWGTLGTIVLTVGLILFITYILAHWLRCPTTTGWLVGFGTAICGSSAIAALSGSVTEDKGDAGIALAVVNLLGLAGMLLWPALLPYLGSGEAFSGMLIGGTLHAVGNVVGAGYAMADEVGQLALTVKLGRVAMLAPGLIFFNWLVHRRSGGLDRFRLPYYIWGFILVVALVALLPVPDPVIQGGKTAGKLLLTVAMAAIGLKISIGQLFRTGRVALGFGVLLFAIQAGLFAGLIFLLH